MSARKECDYSILPIYPQKLVCLEDFVDGNQRENLYLRVGTVEVVLKSKLNTPYKEYYREEVEKDLVRLWKYPTQKQHARGHGRSPKGVIWVNEGETQRKLSVF